MRPSSVCLFSAVTMYSVFGQTYNISTFAGGGLPPANTAATSESLYGPQSAVVDKAGNIFLTDLNDVLKVDAATHILTLVAGNGTAGFSGDNGSAISAQLRSPQGLAFDSIGNLYIADSGNGCIRKVSNGVITTIAGTATPGFSGDNGPAADAQLSSPVGIAFDSSGNLFIADSDSNRVRKVSKGVITTVAGSGSNGSGGDGGPATSAEVYLPRGVALDSTGNLYISDYFNVRKVANGVISTVAGNTQPGFSGDKGPATGAQLNQPYDIAVDSSGVLYIADTYNSRIRKVTNGVITTVAGMGTAGFGGDNAPATGAQLGFPTSVVVDASGSLFIADGKLNHRVRKIAGGVIDTVAGNGVAGSSGDNGPPTSAQLNAPYGVALDSAGNLYFSEGESSRIRKISNGIITTVAGNGTAGFSGDGGPATSAQLDFPKGVAVDSAGNIYIADSLRVRKVSKGVITTLAAEPDVYNPVGVAVDASNNLYILEVFVDPYGTFYQDQGFVHKLANGVLTPVAGVISSRVPPLGDGGPATSAQLNDPSGIAVDSAGNVYIADAGNLRIRKISGGIITTVAGNGTNGLRGDGGPATSAQLAVTTGVAVDIAGNLYFGNYNFGNNLIRKVANGVITTIAGGGSSLGDNGPAARAQLNEPEGVAVDPAGNVYIADSGNNRIRRLVPGPLPTITQGGVVPVYSTIPVIQPGSWVSIYGTGLANGTFVWNGDFPVSLGGVSVSIDNKPAYLWLVSPTQINLQMPDDSTTGMVSVIVTGPNGTAASTVTLAPQGPSFSLLGDGKHAAGEILTQDGSGAYGGGTYDLAGPPGTFSFKTRPVKAGEVLILYGVGFGTTTPTVPPGKAFSGVAPTNSEVNIAIGGALASVAFAGVTQAGLYQFNLTVPANTGSGDQPLQATINGVQTPTGTVLTLQ